MRTRTPNYSIAGAAFHTEKSKEFTEPSTLSPILSGMLPE
jgi:hypothetical protein